jgi:hypothetical protein
MELENIAIAKDSSHHVIDGEPLYKTRFYDVLKFHSPGLAAVVDESGAYHIDITGAAAYKYRYLRTFGFYDGVAAIVDGDKWFHILPYGKRLYKQEYSWCGNFQGKRCVVRDFSGNYFHIDLKGECFYKNRYLYAGDFKDDVAAVQNADGLYSHICSNGELLHDKWFQDLDIFHKGTGLLE